MIGLIDLRLCVDLRERVAIFAELVDDRLRGRLQLFSRETVTRFDLDELGQLRLAVEQIARELDCTDLVRFAFVQRDRQVHVLLVGRDGHLRRVDVELEIATIQVVRAYVFKVAREDLVQIAGSAEMLLISMDTLLIEEDSIPNGERYGVLEPESAEVELPLANAMHQLDA